MTSRSSWPPYGVGPLLGGLNQLANCIAESDDRLHDDERIWLTRFFVVRTCGYLEQVVFDTARAYIDAKSGGPVRTFARSWIEKSRNPTPDNLLALVGRFDNNMREELSDLLDENDRELYREISFLVDRRNKIAHGLNEGLGSRRALELKTHAERVADWFILRLNPDRP